MKIELEFWAARDKYSSENFATDLFRDKPMRGEFDGDVTYTGHTFDLAETIDNACATQPDTCRKFKLTIEEIAE